MWNYLPKTDQVVRVPTSLMLQSWMGSDFTNDDLMKSSSLVRDYRHRVAKVTKQGSEKIIVIECLPKPNAPVVWGKILYYARLSDRLPIRQAYYDEKGQLIRTLTFSHFKKMDDRIVPSVAEVKVAGSAGQTTTIRYGKVLYDREINESLFDKDLLRRSVQNGKSLASGWDTKILPGHERASGMRRARTFGANNPSANSRTF
jgi:Outer membrane lipoprotein-sorting protein